MHRNYIKLSGYLQHICLACEDMTPPRTPMNNGRTKDSLFSFKPVFPTSNRLSKVKKKSLTPNPPHTFFPVSYVKGHCRSDFFLIFMSFNNAIAGSSVNFLVMRSCFPFSF